jgi:hypothetical protein
MMATDCGRQAGRGRWGRSPSDGSLSEASSADGYSCEAPGLDVMRFGPKPRTKSSSGASPLGFMRVRATGQVLRAYSGELDRTGVNCNRNYNSVMSCRSWRTMLLKQRVPRVPGREFACPPGHLIEGWLPGIRGRTRH